MTIEFTLQSVKHSGEVGAPCTLKLSNIEVVFDMPDRDYTDRQKAALEHCAHTCPVHLSLHPDVEQQFVFRWKR